MKNRSTEICQRPRDSEARRAGLPASALLAGALLAGALLLLLGGGAVGPAWAENGLPQTENAAPLGNAQNAAPRGDAETIAPYQRHELPCGISIKLPADWKVSTDQDPGKGALWAVFFKASSTNPKGAMIYITLEDNNAAADEFRGYLRMAKEPGGLKRAGEALMPQMREGLAAAEIVPLEIHPLQVASVDGHAALIMSSRYKRIVDGVTCEARQYQIPLREYMLNVSLICADSERAALEPILDNALKSVQINIFTTAPQAQSKGAKNNAQEKILYEEFWSGMSKEELTDQRKEALAKVTDNIFTAGITTFAGNTWTIFLNFKDAKLTAVVLKMYEADIALQKYDTETSRVKRALWYILVELAHRGFILAQFASGEGLTPDESDSAVVILDGLYDKNLIMLTYDQLRLEKLTSNAGISSAEALELYPPGQPIVSFGYKNDAILVCFMR